MLFSIGMGVNRRIYINLNRKKSILNPYEIINSQSLSPGQFF